MLAVYLTPRSTFPEAIPSNTLFGAICRAMAEFGDDPGVFIDAYKTRPPLLISSCFPFMDAGSVRVRLYPMPVLPPVEQEGVDFDTLKSMKKVRFIDEELFRRLSAGTLKAGGLVKSLKSFSFGSNPHILSSKKHDTRHASAEVDLPHNQINRLTSASQEFYHTTGTQYRSGGLYFLIQHLDKSWENSVAASLRLLADRGIGPRASSGQGYFDLSMDTVDLPDHRDAPFLVTLSRFIPQSFTPFGSDIWYDLITVRGRSGDGIMKKRVLMLAEGAVFRNTGDLHYGQIPAVRESPPAVEYGMAFPIGMRGLS
jgi:CRISPR type III-A-associated RAMP protein Csm4